MKRPELIKIIHEEISKVLRTTTEFDENDCGRLLEVIENSVSIKYSTIDMKTAISIAKKLSNKKSSILGKGDKK